MHELKEMLWHEGRLIEEQIVAAVGAALETSHHPLFCFIDHPQARPSPSEISSGGLATLDLQL